MPTDLYNYRPAPMKSVTNPRAAKKMYRGKGKTGMKMPKMGMHKKMSFPRPDKYGYY